MKNTITKQDLLSGYENLKACIDKYLNIHEVAYQASSEAPSTYRDMVHFYETHGYFKVYSGGNHGILGKEYNIKFRALHDHGHLIYDLSFSFKNERILSDNQKRDMQLIAWNTLGLTAWDVHVIGKIIDCEIRGQIDYFETNGTYVVDQVAFVLNHFNIA